MRRNLQIFYLVVAPVLLSSCGNASSLTFTLPTASETPGSYDQYITLSKVYFCYTDPTFQVESGQTAGPAKYPLIEGWEDGSYTYLLIVTPSDPHCWIRIASTYTYTYNPYTEVLAYDFFYPSKVTACGANETYQTMHATNKMVYPGYKYRIMQSGTSPTQGTMYRVIAEEIWDCWVPANTGTKGPAIIGSGGSGSSVTTTQTHTLTPTLTLTRTLTNSPTNTMTPSRTKTPTLNPTSTNESPVCSSYTNERDCVANDACKWEIPPFGGPGICSDK